MLWHDLILFAWIYFILFLLQLMALPVIFYFSKKITYLKDAGWGFGRIFSALLLALLIWNLAFLRIPINTNLGVSAIFFSLSLLSLFFAWHFFLSKQNFLKNFLKKFSRIIIIEEAVFLLSFIFLFITRSFQPEILGLEKFMDAGFIQAYLKAPVLPAADIWFAGSSINYYSFGQFYNSILVHLWQIDLSYGYNFLLISIFALFCLELFTISFNLKANLNFEKKMIFKNENYNFRAAVFAGILAIFLVALGANGHTIWWLVAHGNYGSYWYPDATRFIERTIHEFPAYSFVVCDLHAHVLSLPVSLLLLFTIFIWLKELLNLQFFAKITFLIKEKFFYLSMVMGTLFGVLVMTNTWDVLIYGSLVAVSSILLLFKNKKLFLPLFLSAANVFVFMAIFSAFWFLNFSAISNGLAIALEHTPLWQLLALYGPHLFWAILFIFMIRPLFSSKKEELAVPILSLALFIMVIALIVFPEFFYFKDIYTTYPRANTMFKLVFQGFMLLGVLLSLFFSVVLFESNKPKKIFSWRLIDFRHLFNNKKQKLFLLKIRARSFLLLYLPIGCFLFFSTIVYPYLAYRSYYGNFKKYQGLDGLTWFMRKYPEDFILMDYLKKTEKTQVNIVEAVGESYTEFARISAFSGMSTILGWRVHEWLWRAGWDQPAKRTGEVEEIYKHPTSKSSKATLEKYQVKYIVLGDKEREAYPKLDEDGLLSLGKIVVSRGNHYLIQIF